MECVMKKSSFSIIVEYYITCFKGHKMKLQGVLVAHQIFQSVRNVSLVENFWWIERNAMNNTWGLAIAVSAFLIQFILYGISLSFGIYVIELQKEFDQGLSLISSIGSIHFGIQLSTGEYFFSLTLQGYISYTSLTFYKVKYIFNCWVY